MSRRFDYAKVYYWRVEFIQPTNPDDDRYIMLHGAEGEIVGPLATQLAKAWMDQFDNRPPAEMKDVASAALRHG